MTREHSARQECRTDLCVPERMLSPRPRPTFTFSLGPNSPTMRALEFNLRALVASDCRCKIERKKPAVCVCVRLRDGRSGGWHCHEKREKERWKRGKGDNGWGNAIPGATKQCAASRLEVKLLSSSPL